MLSPAALAPITWAARLVRSVARARAVVVADASRSTTEGLARHGLTHWPASVAGRRVVAHLGGGPVGAASAREGRTLARLLDLRLPLRAACAVALPVLTGCTTVEDHREAAPVDVYVVEQDTACEPGQHLVTARAECEPGDRVVGGGCSWGEPADPHDVGLAPVLAAPDGEAFACVGQNRGVGAELKTVRASAVCLAGGAS